MRSITMTVDELNAVATTEYRQFACAGWIGSNDVLTVDGDGFVDCWRDVFPNQPIPKIGILVEWYRDSFKSGNSFDFLKVVNGEICKLRID